MSRLVAVIVLLGSALVALPATGAYEGAQRVHPVLGAADVVGADISPDGRHVVIEADLATNGRYDLWSVPLDGSSTTPTLLNDVPVAGGAVIDWKFSRDGSRVLWRGDMLTDGHVELFSAVVGQSGTQVRVSDPAAVGSVIAHDTTDDGSRVVLTQIVAAGLELLSGPTDGSAPPVRLNDPLVAGGQVRDFTISPTEDRVVFSGDVRVDEVDEVFAAPIDQGGGQVRLNEDPPVGGELTTARAFRITPDGTRVLFWGDFTTLDSDALHSAPIDGGGPQLLLSDPASTGFVEDVEITPDGRHAVYAGDLDTANAPELYRAPVDEAGQQVRLSAPLAPGAKGVVAMQLTPDGEQVVYSGELTDSGSRELFTVPVDGSSPQQPILEVPDPGQGVLVFVLTPNGDRAVVLGDVRTSGVMEAFSTPVDGSDAPVRLSPDPVVGGMVDHEVLLVSPDGRRVVIRGDLVEVDRFELWSVPIEGGTATRLNDDLPAGGDVLFDVSISPDSAVVVYTADQAADEVREAWATQRGQLPPRAPTDLAVSDVTDTSATLSWTPPADGGQVTGSTVTLTYEVEDDAAAVRRAAATTERDVAIDGGATTVALDSLAPATTYTATVTSTNDAGGSPASSPVTFTTDGLERLSGPDRYATAAAIALDRFDPDQVDTVFLATGRVFPDALAGGPVAADRAAPILLTRPDELPDVTAQALAALAPGKVVALGGTAAVSEGVLSEAADAAGAGVGTDRIGGADRFATAALLAAELGAVSEVHLATGLAFPDALAGGPLAAADGAAILLTRPDRLPEATAEALGDLAPARVVALGGAAAVAETVLADAARAAGDATTDRLSGDDRFETATAIAAELDIGETVYVATGLDFPDALAGVSPAAAEGAPILLVRTDRVPDATAELLEGLSLRRIVVLGGPAAVGPAVADELAALVTSS